MTSEKDRRDSMRGTFFLALAVIAAGAFLATGSGWLGGVSLIFCVPGVMLLYRVGRAIQR